MFIFFISSLVGG